MTDSVYCHHAMSAPPAAWPLPSGGRRARVRQGTARQQGGDWGSDISTDTTSPSSCAAAVQQLCNSCTAAQLLRFAHRFADRFADRFVHRFAHRFATARKLYSAAALQRCSTTPLQQTALKHYSAAALQRCSAATLQRCQYKVHWEREKERWNMGIGNKIRCNTIRHHPVLP